MFDWLRNKKYKTEFGINIAWFFLHWCGQLDDLVPIADLNFQTGHKQHYFMRRW